MVLAHTRSRLVRLLFAWAPRIMRALKLQLPKWGLVLRVDGGGSIVQVRVRELSPALCASALGRDGR
jgi:hypothetical protein